MKTMLLSSQYTNLNEFLSQHNAKGGINGTKDGSKTHTHTRIKSEKFSVYGGSYIIDKEELPVFRRLYYENVFVKGKKEYLTEKQLEKNGPILVDLDFRYDYSVYKRQHTKEHIQDIVELYLEELKEFFIFEENKSFPIFILEKEHVNRVSETDGTKDGIHIIIGLQMDRTLQIMLRDKIVSKIVDILELPITNTWDKVVDEGVSKGSVNWQMYGSQKPGNEAYKVTY